MERSNRVAIRCRDIKTEQNNAICSDMDGPRDCHTEWSKSEKDKCHDIAYMWNIRKGHRWTYFKRGRVTNVEDKLMVTMELGEVE